MPLLHYLACPAKVVQKRQTMQHAMLPWWAVTPFSIYRCRDMGLRMLLLLHAVIPCLFLHAVPCFFPFWHFNPSIPSPPKNLGTTPTSSQTTPILITCTNNSWRDGILSIVATLCTGFLQDSMKAAILVMESWWYSSCSWRLNCLVQTEKGLLTSEPSFCCL